MLTKELVKCSRACSTSSISVVQRILLLEMWVKKAYSFKCFAFLASVHGQLVGGGEQGRHGKGRGKVERNTGCCQNQETLVRLGTKRRFCAGTRRRTGNRQGKHRGYIDTRNRWRWSGWGETVRKKDKTTQPRGIWNERRGWYTRQEQGQNYNMDPDITDFANPALLMQATGQWSLRPSAKTQEAVTLSLLLQRISSINAVFEGSFKLGLVGSSVICARLRWSHHFSFRQCETFVNHKRLKSPRASISELEYWSSLSSYQLHWRYLRVVCLHPQQWLQYYKIIQISEQ